MSASTRKAVSSRSRSRASPTPKSEEAQRICQQDLNEVIAAFVQDKNTIERGLFDPELVPEELTQVRMGKIIKDKYPELDEEDQEAVRQHAVAALNLTQKAKELPCGGTEGEARRTRTPHSSTASGSSPWTCANWTST